MVSSRKGFRNKRVIGRHPEGSQPNKKEGVDPPRRGGA